MIDPSAQAKASLEILKKEREKYDPSQDEWHMLTVNISHLKRSIERWEKMKKNGVKF